MSPSTEIFNRCRKKDFLLIADFFDVSLTKTGTKQAIKEELYGKLVERGILPADSQVDLEAEGALSETSSIACPTGPNVGMDPTLAVRLKELELAIKQQEHETRVVQLRTLEVEAERDIKLRSLELEAESLRLRPHPAPNFPSPLMPNTPVDSSTANYGAATGDQVNFDVTKLSQGDCMQHGGTHIPWFVSPQGGGVSRGTKTSSIGCPDCKLGTGVQRKCVESDWLTADGRCFKGEDF